MAVLQVVPSAARVISGVSPRDDQVSIGPVLPEDMGALFVWLNDADTAPSDMTYRPVDAIAFKGWLEEQTKQQPLEWLDVAFKLMAKFAVGKHDTGKKGTESRRQADDAHQQGDRVGSHDLEIRHDTFNRTYRGTKRGYVRSSHFRGNVCGEVNLPARCSHGIKTCWRIA